VSTILVAEDDDGVRQLILVALQRSGHTVLGTANGREAMAMLSREDVAIDLLVSDVNMPGVGGLELLAFARARRPDLPAILASGTNRWELPPERLEGDVTLLEKPFSIVDLVRAVGDALRPEGSTADSVPATKTDMGAEGDDGQVFGG
jgi:two-component system, cell cycle sensor histidine kinase and response regulator CckA